MPDAKKIQKLFNQSVELAESEDFDGAIKILNDLIAYAPIPDAHRNRARCYTELIRSGKELPPEKQIRQWLFHAKDDLTEAIRIYKEMPANAYSKNHGDEMLSDCYHERGEIKMMLATTYKGALTALDEADLSDAMELERVLEMVDGEDTVALRDALNDANEAIRYGANNVWAYRLKGFIYDTHFDDPQTAIAQFSKAISINAGPLDYFNRAWCNYLVGNKKDAYSDCKRAMQLDPEIRKVVPISANRAKRDQWEGFWKDCIQD